MFLLGQVLEKEIFTGEELKDGEDNGPIDLEWYFDNFIRIF